MTEYFIQLNPVYQALLATCFTWFLTALGASVVFVTRSIDKKLLDFSLGLSGGVMIAASVWSLLIPSINMSESRYDMPWVPAATGFLFGAAFIRIVDKILPHLHLGFPLSEAEGIKTHWKRNVLLVMAITLHNIPEGLAIGVAFGALATGFEGATLASAMTLALGIGLQNLPEGLAISMPLRRDGMSRLKSFYYGQLSAVVEPVAAFIGAAAVLYINPILPYALGFAAGAMIFVVIEELVPESQRSGNTDLATSGTILGFIFMMILDIQFG
ncbi:MAG: ZIP family metal transporter [Candidatus Dadabacteria bacterium]|nr:ZIP family metal transporter [Candidatus Dadabacteria bacterium]NIS10202.1 ZIP family metal transporter [Candidatus Dadabacteria bacterium]NIV42637.1 ZIP family metal transporter [Candidatus Dadabacteria bacterium]NIX16568.1 ZIP family metal transporter [Candidatus Dadabacteria bacterium]NIY23117.1 ZIP family metal transporter [Candidatus Dadabacteria bacterium]